MGNNMNSICCQNNFENKGGEGDIELFKRDTILSKKREMKEENIVKNQKQKEFQLIKDNSFKQNSLHNSRMEIKDKLSKLSEIAANNLSPVLCLRVLNSNINGISKGTVISINCQGMLNSPYKDGIVYFGNSDNERIDFTIQNLLNENGEGTNNIGRHFQVEYILERMAFFIRDLGIGYGTFVKLTNSLILKDNQLINIGETFIVVNILEKNEDLSHLSQAGGTSLISKASQLHHLKLKVYGVNNNGETFYFPPMNRNVNIGRYTLADVFVNDKLLSKIHCVINYSEGIGWTLLDGHNNKPSTNGTWLYMNEEIEIFDKMIFKSNQTIFHCSLNSRAENDSREVY